MRKLQPGDSTTADHGTLTLKTTRWHDGLHLLVMCGPARVETLTRPFTNTELPLARAWYAEIRTAADAGLPVWQIEARLKALTAAGEALRTTAVAVTA